MVKKRKHSEMLLSIEEDIAEYGKDHYVSLWLKLVDGVFVILNYDEMYDDERVYVGFNEECGEDEYEVYFTLEKVKEFLITKKVIL